MAYHKTKLDKKEIEKLFFRLCLAISGMKNPQEAAEFIRDLLSYQEAEMIAKRLMIAESILDNQSYAEIREKLKVSNGTIARVQEWLKISGEGYRRAVVCIKGEKDKTSIPIEKFSEWNSIKKRFPVYFWPQLLLEEIVRNSSKRQSQRIRNVMKELEKSKKKNTLFRRIDKILTTRKS